MTGPTTALNLVTYAAEAAAIRNPGNYWTRGHRVLALVAAELGYPVPRQYEMDALRYFFAAARNNTDK